MAAPVRCSAQVFVCFGELQLLAFLLGPQAVSCGGPITNDNCARSLADIGCYAG